MNVDERRLMKNTGGEDLSISIRWFVRSWVQIKGDGKVVYVDPAYVKTYFTDYDPIQGQWARLEKAAWFILPLLGQKNWLTN